MINLKDRIKNKKTKNCVALRDKKPGFPLLPTVLL
jgi:hypothetical protein